MRESQHCTVNEREGQLIFDFSCVMQQRAEIFVWYTTIRNATDRVPVWSAVRLVMTGSAQHATFARHTRHIYRHEGRLSSTGSIKRGEIELHTHGHGQENMSSASRHQSTISTLL